MNTSSPRCSEYPLRALWTAHRHLKEPSTPIRVASLVLASEALWQLEYFEDVRIAAQAAVEADPKSAQALWRLAVALYRRGRFSDSAKCLDDLLRLVNQFGPAWALRGQVKVWLDPDNSDAGRSDFAAAAKLNPIPVPLGNSIVSLTWPFRLRGWCGEGWLTRCCSRSSAC